MKSKLPPVETHHQELAKTLQKLKDQLYRAHGPGAETAGHKLALRAFDGDEDALAILLEAARKAKKSKTVIAALVNLSKLGRKAALYIEVFLKQLHSQDKDIAITAISCLGNLKEEASRKAIPDLVRVYDDTDSEEVRDYARSKLYLWTRDERWKGKRVFHVIEAAFDHPIYSSPIVIGGRTLRKTDKDTKGNPGKVGNKSRSKIRFASEDDPIYKRGWTVTVARSNKPVKPN